MPRRRNATLGDMLPPSQDKQPSALPSLIQLRHRGFQDKSHCTMLPRNGRSQESREPGVGYKIRVLQLYESLKGYRPHFSDIFLSPHPKGTSYRPFY